MRHKYVRNAEVTDERVKRALRGACTECGGEPHGLAHEQMIAKYQSAWRRWQSRDAEKRLGHGQDAQTKADKHYAEEYGKEPALPNKWAVHLKLRCQCGATYGQKLTTIVKLLANGVTCELAQTKSWDRGHCKACALEADAAEFEKAAADNRREAEAYRRRHKA